MKVAVKLEFESCAQRALKHIEAGKSEDLACDLEQSAAIPKSALLAYLKTHYSKKLPSQAKPA